MTSIFMAIMMFGANYLLLGEILLKGKSEQLTASSLLIHLFLLTENY